MPENLNPEHQLEYLKELRQKYEAVLAEAQKSGDYSEAEKLKEELETRLSALEALFPKPEIVKNDIEIKLNLRSQYNEQKDLLKETLMAWQSSQDSLPYFFGIHPEDPNDNLEYPFPSFEAISSSLREQSAELESKINQGFTKLLMVPIAMPLKHLTGVYNELLKKHHKKQKLLNSEGQNVGLETQRPLWIPMDYTNADIEGKLIYYPQRFNEKNHDGMTKQQLIQQTMTTKFPGWLVTLVEDLPNLPGLGKGQTITDRAQVEANQSPIDYLKQTQEDPRYEGELGYTPEQWLTQAILHLETTNQVFDDYIGKGRVCFLTGSYFPSTGKVPYAFWDTDHKRVYLVLFDKERGGEDYSARRSVRVGK